MNSTLVPKIKIADTKGDDKAYAETVITPSDFLPTKIILPLSISDAGLMAAFLADRKCTLKKNGKPLSIVHPQEIITEYQALEYFRQHVSIGFLQNERLLAKHFIEFRSQHLEEWVQPCDDTGKSCGKAVRVPRREFFMVAEKMINNMLVNPSRYVGTPMINRITEPPLITQSFILNKALSLLFARDRLWVEWSFYECIGYNFNRDRFFSPETLEALKYDFILRANDPLATNIVLDEKRERYHVRALTYLNKATKMTQPEEVLALYQHALAFQPRSRMAWICYHQALLLQQDTHRLEEALDLCKKAREYISKERNYHHYIHYEDRISNDMLSKLEQQLNTAILNAKAAATVSDHKVAASAPSLADLSKSAASTATAASSTTAATGAMSSSSVAQPAYPITPSAPSAGPAQPPAQTPPAAQPPQENTTAPTAADESSKPYYPHPAALFQSAAPKLPPADTPTPAMPTP